MFLSGNINIFIEIHISSVAKSLLKHRNIYNIINFSYYIYYFYFLQIYSRKQYNISKLSKFFKFLRISQQSANLLKNRGPNIKIFNDNNNNNNTNNNIIQSSFFKYIYILFSDYRSIVARLSLNYRTTIIRLS